MNLKEIKHRILSVKNTQKITSAMKLVSSAKLRRAQSVIDSMHPYKNSLDAMLATLLADSRSLRSEALKQYTATREEMRVVLVAISSDTGLCGAFNANVARLMAAVTEDYKAKGADTAVLAVGNKMCDAVRKLGMEPDTRFTALAGSSDYNSVAQMADELTEQFLGGKIDRVELIYTRLESMSRHTPVRKQLLPIVPDNDCCRDDAPQEGLIVEPGYEELLASLLPKTVALELYYTLLESAVSEHAARMVAMQLATDNADDLIASLTLEYNKGRQQAITSEILDIVGGSSNE